MAIESGSGVASQRFASQLLSGTPARHVVDVVRRICAMQAQDPMGARLAVRARSTNLRAADVDAALADGSVVISWLNRGTLHLVAAEDYWWLHSLTAHRILPAVRRRLAQEGVSAEMTERGIAVVWRALSNGPMRRADLRAAVAAAGVRTEGQAFIQLAAFAALNGFLLRGPMLGKQHAYVLAADWLPARRPLEENEALAELARRYLAGHAPASDRDLAKWAGISLGEARRALSAIASEVTDCGDGMVRLRGRPGQGGMPAPQLLGSFEPVLMGWHSRSWVLGENQSRLVRGGMFLPFALVAGRAAATWQRTDRAVALEPFAPISATARRELDEDGRNLLRFLGLQPAAAAVSSAAKPPQTRAAR
ncbi:MAG: AlkZ family DNA glycosylase [Candidatus Dormibacteraeota bacterium]|nr:AlkZ family DNA glycosylase [Candidatus Dormibacteraeota bacterium]